LRSPESSVINCWILCQYGSWFFCEPMQSRTIMYCLAMLVGLGAGFFLGFTSSRVEQVIRSPEVSRTIMRPLMSLILRQAQAPGAYPFNSSNVSSKLPERLLQLLPSENQVDCRQTLMMQDSNFKISQGNVGVKFAGRMCNNMIQYIIARIHARKRGNGIIKISGGESLPKLHTIVWYKANGATVDAETFCSSVFAQYYLILKRHRRLAECLFSPSILAWKPKQGLSLTPLEVVIHIRNPVADESGGHLGNIFPLCSR
jgi:hypothetical protein